MFTSSWDSVCEAGIEALRKALKCKTLPALKISKTNISDIDIVVAELEHSLNIRRLEFVVTSLLILYQLYVESYSV